MNRAPDINRQLDNTGLPITTDVLYVTLYITSYNLKANYLYRKCLFRNMKPELKLRFFLSRTKTWLTFYSSIVSFAKWLKSRTFRRKLEEISNQMQSNAIIIHENYYLRREYHIHTWIDNYLHDSLFLTRGQILFFNNSVLLFDWSLCCFKSIITSLFKYFYGLFDLRIPNNAIQTDKPRIQINNKRGFKFFGSIDQSSQ